MENTTPVNFPEIPARKSPRAKTVVAGVLVRGSS